MKLESEKVLKRFRGAGRCELCSRWCKAREPHHHQRKGFGGGFCLDVSIGLIALGASPTFECPCHGLVTAGKISDARVLAVIAKRHGVEPDEIQEAIWVLARLPKRASKQVIEEHVAEVSEAVSRLVVASLKEVDHAG